MLPFPANGNITYNPVTNVATYSCGPGYALNNTGQRTCQNNSQWSGTNTICERKEKEDVFVDVYLLYIHTQLSCVRHSPTLLMDK